MLTLTINLDICRIVNWKLLLVESDFNLIIILQNLLTIVKTSWSYQTEKLRSNQSTSKKNIRSDVDQITWFIEVLCPLKNPLQAHQGDYQIGHSLK